MRFIKGYRIVDVPVGMGAVLHPLYIKEHNNPTALTTSSSSNVKGRVAFVGNVDYGKDRTLEEIDGYLRDLLSAFGDIESVSVSNLNTHDNDDDEQEPTEPIDTTAYSFGNPNAICGFSPDMCVFGVEATVSGMNRDPFEARFAHVVFAQKSGLKACLAASDTMYYTLTKEVQFTN